MSRRAWAKVPTGLWAELRERVEHWLTEWRHARTHKKPTDADLQQAVSIAERRRELGLIDP